MRPIKFRAWDKEAKEMISWEDICGRYDFCIEIIDAEEMIVEQFTGLSDKNGKEIWEGDKVEYEDGSIKWTKTVQWDDDISGWLPFCVPIDYDEVYLKKACIEVIGTIHDKAELLKHPQEIQS